MGTTKRTNSKPNSVISFYKGLLIALLVILFIGSGVLIVRAVPPGTQYLPGETLDPNCGPGDPNCSVNQNDGSLNNQSGDNQTLVTGTAGTDFSINSASDIHTFNIPSASLTARGLLTAPDWLIFNSKESPLTFTGPLTRIGDTVSFVGTTSDVPEGINLYFTNLRAQQAVGNITTDTANITLTYDTIGNTLSADLTDTGVTPGTYNNITVDAKGRTTLGSLIAYLTSAVTSLNGLTSSAQTLTTGSLGTDFTINSSGSTHTFNIPD